MNTLVVALGNPGKKYELTRHNIAWLLIDGMESEFNLNWQKKFKGLYSTYQKGGDKIIFLKPQTYMNLSGESVVACAQFFKIDINNILVVHDEIDMDYGVIAFKKGGGLAGHNGLKSIAGLLGRQDFLRFRLGVGRPPRGSVSSWVLSPFSKDEECLLTNYLEEAAKALQEFIASGIEKASTKFNRNKLV